MEERTRLQRHQSSAAPVSIFAPSSLGQRAHQADVMRSPAAISSIGHDFSRIPIFPPVQAKLTVGQPDDPYEQEADRVADEVMRMQMPAPLPLFPPPPEGMVNQMPEPHGVLAMRSLSERIDRKCAACEEEEVQTKTMVQRSGNGALQTEDDLESRLSSSKGGGSPLPDEVRSFMEPRFGYDFSQVRVHVSNEAVQMSRELSAQAFTYGSNIYFGAGKSPGTNELTAHELTHVIQQTGSASRSIQRECGVDETCVEEPNASYPEPNASYPEPDHSATSQEQTELASDESGMSLVAGAVFTPPGPGSPICAQLLQEIINFLDGGGKMHRGLKERYDDMLQDTEKLYLNHRTKSNPHPGGKGSWDGHVEQYQGQQRGLLKKINNWIKNGCDGPGGPPLPADAEEFATRPAPSQPNYAVNANRSAESSSEISSEQFDQGFMEKMAAITGLSGAALIAYIIVSEGTRLFPPRNLIPVP